MSSRQAIPTTARGRIVALAVISMVASTTLVALPGSPAAAASADPAVIGDWNEVAVATIVTDAGKASVEAFMWLAYEQAAVYNAVVGITRRYELYRWNSLGPRWASPEAAAATAAHDILLEYFPASETRLVRRADRVAGRDPRRRREGRRHGIRRTGRTPDHRAAGRRRSVRERALRRATGARRVATDATDVHTVLRNVVGEARSVRHPVAQRVPTRPAAGAPERRLHPRVPRGEAAGLRRLDLAQPGADEDGIVLLRRRDRWVPGRHA